MQRKKPGPARRIRIGLMVESSHEFGRAILTGITRFTRGRDDWELDSHAPFHPSAGRRPDALIVRAASPEQLASAPRDRPRVVLTHDASIAGAHLCWDNASLGRLAAEHLLEQGHRALAAVLKIGQPWQAARVQGYLKVAAEAGVAVEQIPDDKLPAGLAELPRPAGVMAATDALAREVLWAAEANGQRVPEDLAVVGIGNDEVFCETTPPPLTSVALPGEELGFQAAGMLERHLAGEPLPDQPVLVPGDYVAVRRSSEMLAIDDPVVVRALKMIRDSRLAGVTIADIREAAGVSQRSLELRFRKAVGRSLREEIWRVRTDRARRLLRETDWPIERIARQADFDSAGQLWRTFTRLTGASPSAYRERQTGVLTPRARRAHQP